jgi:pimeloyl-ACP methyl ester carboxylesterase/DNA-binding CsgD family transcriptional regulator
MDAPPIQYARTEDGVNIAFWTLGQGQPLIEQSQSPYSHCEALWRSKNATGWFTHLATGRQLVYLDHRGQGLSDREPGDFSPEACALDIAAVADRLGLDRFDLFGVGYASPAAIQFAADHPHRLRRLVLWQPLSHAGARYSQFKDMLPLIEDNVDFFLEAIVRWGYPQITPDQISAQLRWIRLCVDPPALRAAYEAYAQVDVRDALRRITAPSLVLDRRDDRVLKDSALAETAAMLRNASLRLLDGTSPGPFSSDDWETVALTLEQFLDAPDPDPPPPTKAEIRAEQTALTPRERDVLRILVAGQRNRDIAATLNIAPATVARHVSNLLHKTGCSNRTELARYAADHALTRKP